MEGFFVMGFREKLKYLTKDKGRHKNSPQLNHEVLYFILPTFPLRADEPWGSGRGVLKVACQKHIIRLACLCYSVP